MAPVPVMVVLLPCKPAPGQLRKQIGDANDRGRHSEWRHGAARVERLDGQITPAREGRPRSRRLPMDFEYAIDEVDDPVVRDPAAGVGCHLPPPCDPEARERDLDDERREPWMLADVVAQSATDDRHVGLRFRACAEDDRALCLNEPSSSEGTLERLSREQHGGAMRARLRLLHEQQPVEQLDWVVLVEEAVVDQASVRVAGPAIEARLLGLPHGTEPMRGVETLSMSPNCDRQGKRSAQLKALGLSAPVLRVSVIGPIGATLPRYILLFMDVDGEICRVLAERHDVRLAYLFGSAAAGLARRGSDADIAILFDEVPAPGALDRLSEHLGAAIRRLVDLVVLNRATPLLAREVVGRGRLLLCRDEEERIRFETDTTTRYQDTAHLRRLQYAYLRERAEAHRAGPR